MQKLGWLVTATASNCSAVARCTVTASVLQCGIWHGNSLRSRRICVACSFQPLIDISRVCLSTCGRRERRVRWKLSAVQLKSCWTW